ncbi:hypothetical protein SDC9_127991 [bioreactor metagenome]|uniref:Uncharacterized protein n=1 Tax=bioreactor metagenome TaxID=1076179 RepID=A0A645CUV9_9ZZZZ
MFIKIHCPVCGSDMYHDIRLSALEYLHFEGEMEACRYVIKNIEVQDSLTEEELVRSILYSLQKVIHDGIKIETLIEALEANYGVTGNCCMEIIERIQIELGMYCPDRKRLYFADPGESGSYTKKNNLYFF